MEEDAPNGDHKYIATYVLQDTDVSAGGQVEAGLELLWGSRVVQGGTGWLGQATEHEGKLTYCSGQALPAKPRT